MENISTVVVLAQVEPGTPRQSQGRYWLSQLALLHSVMILCVKV
jgi:hypothetical protein